MNKYIFLISLTLLYSCIESSQKSTVSEEITENKYKNGDLTFDNSDIVTLADTIETTAHKTKEELLVQDGYQPRVMENGQMDPCYNFSPKLSKIDNSLKVTVGGGTDVVIKLMDTQTDKCIRYVFINRNTSYRIKNIPEGKYYLKIAYGKNWFSKNENGKCIGKFSENPMYEKGEDVMDFSLVRSANSYQIPSYDLELDVISYNAMNSFTSTNISEETFNN